MRRPSRRFRRDVPSRALLDSLLKTWAETGDYAEVDRGKVLVRGAWSANYPHGPRFYVAVFEEPKNRVSLWQRRDDNGAWRLWGMYWLREYDGDMRELMRVLASDLRYELLPLEVRAAERRQRTRILQQRASRGL